MKVLTGTTVVVAACMALLSAGVRGEAPTLPVGVFYTSPRVDVRYVDGVARTLRAAHFDTVVATESFTKETVDVFQKHGIAVVSLGDTMFAGGQAPNDSPSPIAQIDIIEAIGVLAIKHDEIARGMPTRAGPGKLQRADVSDALALGFTRLDNA